MRIEKNKEYNSIELYFDTIPNKETREILKGANFKWHGLKKCWYAKENEKTMEIAKKLESGETLTTSELPQQVEQTKLLSLRKLDENEKHEYAKLVWDTPSMQDYLCETYDIYITKDNLYIEIEKYNKLSITKDIWYDDELPSDQVPTANLQNFLYENEKNCNRYDYYIKRHGNEYDKFYWRHNSTTCQSNIDLVVMDNWEIADNKYGYAQLIIRELTNDEIQDILSLYKEQKEKYIDRLHKYYKRYGNNVHARGYWANR